MHHDLLPQSCAIQISGIHTEPASHGHRTIAPELSGVPSCALLSCFKLGILRTMRTMLVRAQNDSLQLVTSSDLHLCFKLGIFETIETIVIKFKRYKA